MTGIYTCLPLKKSLTDSTFTIISATLVTLPITSPHNKFFQLSTLAYIKTSKMDTALLGAVKKSEKKNKKNCRVWWNKMKKLWADVTTSWNNSKQDSTAVTQWYLYPQVLKLLIHCQCWSIEIFKKSFWKSSTVKIGSVHILHNHSPSMKPTLTRWGSLSG